MTDKDILTGIIKSSNMSVKKFSEHIGLKTPQVLYDILKGRNGISKDLAEMLKKINTASEIPVYDDVATIGGVNNSLAVTEGVSQPSEYIDTGDWFKEASAALRHYGDSMVEYPSGCILALKELHERGLVVWGRDYVIETDEYRITKRIQRGSSIDYIIAYSTNKETYPDGRQIHEPIEVEWRSIRRIFLVLGYVVKKNGGTLMSSSQQR